MPTNSFQALRAVDQTPTIVSSRVSSTPGNPGSGGTTRGADKSRTCEKESIGRANDALEDIAEENTCDYLPTISATKEYSQFQSASESIRRTVLTDEALDDYLCRANRLPHLVFMPKYEPITTVTTDWNKFFVEFFSLFYGKHL